MNLRDGAKVLTLAGALLSCGGNSLGRGLAESGKASCPVGAVFKDLYLYVPPEAEGLDGTGEVEEIVRGLQRRILFIAGPDKAEDVDRLCTTVVERDFCPIYRNTGIVEAAERFSKAVDNCMSDASDGSPPDERGSVQLDVECFLNINLPARDQANTEDAEKKCADLRYACYRGAYLTLRSTALDR